MKKVNFFEDVQQAEAEAIDWGCHVAKEIGQSLVLLNTDSQGIADLVNKRKNNKTPIFWIISEIKKLISEFSECKVQFTPRTCNVQAHQLAKLALGYEEAVIWVDSPPEYVRSFLQVSF